MAKFAAAAVAVALAILVPAGTAGAHGAAPHARLVVSPTRLSYLGGRVSLRWSSTHAKNCTLAANPGFVSLVKPKRVRCNGRLSLTLDRAGDATRWTFRFRARDGRGRGTTVRRTLVRRRPPFLVSANWAGYFVPSNDPVTEVSGEFTVPTLDCGHIPHSGVSTWVGTGGVGGSSGDLLQTGVRSNCILGSQAVNPAWWALFPAYREVDFDSGFVSAGDSIRASVTKNADGSWTTRLDDLTSGISGIMTTGDAYGTVSDSNPTVWLEQDGTAANVSYAGGYTADWIVEDFEERGRLATLADFGTIGFTNLTTSLPPSWILTSPEGVGIGDALGNLWAIPSQPDPSSRGFSVSYNG
jgi:hypothetical protein